MTTLEERLKAEARRLGFDLVGIAAAVPADGFDRLRAWLDRGFAGEMRYLHEQAEARRHPSSVYPPVRSVVMVGLNYKPEEPTSPPHPPSPKEGGGSKTKDTSRSELGSVPPPALGEGVRGRGWLTGEGRKTVGRIARYARGADYHKFLRLRLKSLRAWLQAERPGSWGRVAVDTAPLMERDFARRAGLGWFGKNTLLLDCRLGSFLLLGAVLTSVELRPDEPTTTAHCGTCTACLDACPTGAFVEPFVLDARRCISYLTIELQSSMPENQRPEIGDWLYGCDICQEVCPWNRHAPVAEFFPARSDLVALDPIELLSLSEEAFRVRFAGTVFLRPGRGGLLRNAAIVLGNTAGVEALPALERALSDADPLVREAAEWACAEIRRRC
jgi:epoxyqueuosine reductase